MAAIQNATSGISTMTISQAFIETGLPRMYIPDDAFVEIINYDTSRERSILTRKNRRNLAAKTGVLNAIVIRVIDKNNVAPNPSIAQLYNDIFDDEVCLRSQINKCSYGKLRIEPFRATTNGHTVQNGIVDVKIDFDTSASDNKGDLQQSAMDAASAKLGDLNNNKFGLVMFCMPPGTGNWLAYAFSNHKYTFYNNNWCTSVTVQVHEVGHNLGLAHSGQLHKSNYDDQTGMMGYSFNEDDTSMCFNPAKNYQLGWYNDKVKTIDPLSFDLDIDAHRDYTLNGVADYKKNNDSKNPLVVLRLEQTGSVQDYYVGFNRATGINEDTKEDANAITIVRKDVGSPYTYGQSTKMARVMPGESYTIANFNGQRDVRVQFYGYIDGDATVRITDVDNVANYNDLEPNCKKFFFEVKTDSYPGDNSWSVIEDQGIGKVVAMSTAFTQENYIYRQEVCLPYSKNYKVFIRDTYRDGFQENGYYKVFNDQNQEIYFVDRGFDVREHSINVGADPVPPPPSEPPSSRPTNAPTMPPPCAMFTIDVTTDKHPEDNSWTISGDGQNQVVLFESPPITEKSKLYRSKVCLQYDKEYKFVLIDDYKDGLCCEEGNGNYKIIDPNGEQIVWSNNKEEKFGSKEERINVKSKSTYCQNKKKKFKAKKKGRKRSCKWYQKKGRCDNRAFGIPIWRMCAKACNRCDDL